MKTRIRVPQRSIPPLVLAVHYEYFEIDSISGSRSIYPMGLDVTILPVVTKDLPISPWFTPYNF